MSDPHATDQRLTELEIKASYAEDLLDQLNQIIYRQQQQIDRLERELRREIADSARGQRQEQAQGCADKFVMGTSPAASSRRRGSAAERRSRQPRGVPYAPQVSASAGTHAALSVKELKS